MHFSSKDVPTLDPMEIPKTPEELHLRWYVGHVLHFSELVAVPRHHLHALAERITMQPAPTLLNAEPAPSLFFEPNNPHSPKQVGPVLRTMSVGIGFLLAFAAGIAPEVSLESRATLDFSEGGRVPAPLEPSQPSSRVSAPQAGALDVRPNFVFILTDDLDALTMPYWEALPQTKRLLAEQGLTFTQAYAPTPICCAARASILTGRYGHNTGVLTNGGDQGGWETFFASDQEADTFVVALEAAGYRTGLFGKYMNGIERAPDHIPPGWTDWVVGTDIDLYTGYDYTLNENGVEVSYGNAPADYATDVLRDKALDFLESTEVEDDRPFFLTYASTAPHLPLPPAVRHSNHPYQNAQAPRRANYNESDISDKASWLRLSGTRRATSVSNWVDPDYRNRMGSLYALDEAIAALIETLDQNGELENTWIVFTSDNGYNFGAHRLLHKMAPYAESVKIPLVIRGPGGVTGETAAQSLLIDLAPTFLELAGLPASPRIDGVSLVPWLRGQPPTVWRTDFVSQYHGGEVTNGIGAELPPAFLYLATGLDVPSWRALRSRDYLFIKWYDADGLNGYHEYELYDLKKDPYELVNVLARPLTALAYQSVRQQLEQRLATLLTCAGENCHP